ncbi:MAG: hypothetical protein ACK4K7_03030 [Allosphingosinicella sp.]|uniref:hypothetical protein n=1 Tax=Allosphingosinicella sp. TaxID=2823234 RepID=UPI003940FB76
MKLYQMPAKGASGQEFEPQRVDYSAPEAGGYLGGVQAGFPLWFAVWTLGRMGADASDAWRAWHIGMRGSQRRFLGYDLGRPFPKHYRDGFSRTTNVDGTPFDGVAASWSQTIDADGEAHLTLTGLPAGLLLSTGDYVGLRWDAAGLPAGNMVRRTVARLRGPGVANAAGTWTGIVEPPLPPLVPAGAIAHLDRPSCVMALVSGETKLGSIDRRLAIGGGRIVALQDLRA